MPSFFPLNFRGFGLGTITSCRGVIFFSAEGAGGTGGYTGNGDFGLGLSPVLVTTTSTLGVLLALLVLVAVLMDYTVRLVLISSANWLPG